MTPGELRRRRQALGLSQRALAAALGLPQVTIWRWETGATIQHPTILTLALEALETRAGISGLTD